MNESIYNSSYYVEDIPEDIKKICLNPKIESSPNNLKLDLPMKNIFIPKNFNIFDLEIKKYPSKIFETK